MLKRRLACILTAAALALSMQITVFAHNILDWSQDGAGFICVHMNYSPDTADCGSLVLLKVADVQEIDGDCAFVPTADFAPVWKEDADFQDPQFAWDLTAHAAKLDCEFVTVQVINEGDEGVAVFENLELGLYLVSQAEAAEGYEAINPFLIGVPNLEDGAYTYQVNASPKVSVKPLPAKPTVPPETEPTRPPEPNLPQTGQLNWPIPLMAAAGLLLFAGGWSMCFRSRKERNEG